MSTIFRKNLSEKSRSVLKNYFGNETETPQNFYLLKKGNAEDNRTVDGKLAHGATRQNHNCLHLHSKDVQRIKAEAELKSLCATMKKDGKTDVRLTVCDTSLRLVSPRPLGCSIPAQLTRRSRCSIVDAVARAASTTLCSFMQSICSTVSLKKTTKGELTIRKGEHENTCTLIRANQETPCLIHFFENHFRSS